MIFLLQILSFKLFKSYCTTLQEHTELYKKQYDQLPGIITVDAGYGSEENYQYLCNNNIENYVSVIILIRTKVINQIKNIHLKPIHFITTLSTITTSAVMVQQMQNIGTHQTKTKTGLHKPSHAPGNQLQWLPAK